MHSYIVTYDICHPKRLRRVFAVLSSWGEHLQYSVFQCHLGDSELVRLRCQLSDIIHHREDQILFINIGPAYGRSTQAISSLGVPYVPPERSAFVF